MKFISFLNFAQQKKRKVVCFMFGVAFENSTNISSVSHLACDPNLKLAWDGCSHCLFPLLFSSQLHIE